MVGEADDSIMIYHDIRFRRDEVLAVYTVRLENLQSGETSSLTD